MADLLTDDQVRGVLLLITSGQPAASGPWQRTSDDWPEWTKPPVPHVQRHIRPTPAMASSVGANAARTV
jgi:hypothetical protein